MTSAQATPPFARILAPFADALPPAFAQQFLQSTPVRLEGVMHQVWHKPMLRPMFWLLGTLGILTGKVGKDIPTTLVVEPARQGQFFRRILRFDPPVQFNSLNTYNPETARVMEWIGPGNALGMVWDVKFQPPGTLVLVTCGWVLRLGRVHLTVPGWLWRWTLGRADATQYVDGNRADTVHIDLVIRHTLFGDVFGFSGTFQVLGAEELM